MYALFCGSRSWDEPGSRDWVKDAIRQELRTLDPQSDIIVHGAAPGADSIAAWEAELMGFRIVAFPAEWGRLGPGAGPARNSMICGYLTRMIRHGESAMVYAFHLDPSLGSGTADMVAKATKAGITSKLRTLMEGPADSETASFIIHDGDGRMLLQHRTDDAPTFPGHHGLFGGSLEPGESPEDALRREAMEELGIELCGAVKAGTHMFRLPGRTMRMNVWTAPLLWRLEDLAARQREGQGLGLYSLRETELMRVPDQDKAVLRAIQMELTRPEVRARPRSVGNGRANRI